MTWKGILEHLRRRACLSSRAWVAAALVLALPAAAPGAWAQAPAEDGESASEARLEDRDGRLLAHATSTILVLQD